MAIQFKEIKNKTEDLMEQGNEAQKNVTTSKARVGQAQSDLANAMQELDRASQTDEDGKPLGDVGAAQARVNMAQNQLAASKRALAEAERHLESVNESKKGLAAEIAAHNDIERSNLDKLKALKSRAFADSSNALTEGIANRLNEAEDARAELLASLGIHDGAQRVSGGGAGGGIQTWGSVSLSEIDTRGEAVDARTSGNSEGVGGPVPLAVASQSNFTPVPSDFNSHPAADIKNSFDYVDRNYDRSSPEWQENANRRVEYLNGQITDIQRRMEASHERQWEARREMDAYLLLDDTHTENDPAYAKLWSNYNKCSTEWLELERQRVRLVNQRDSISANIDPAQVTTFSGFRGSDFAHSYDGMITSRQGRSVDGYKGTCGLNESCSIINQQCGTRYDEPYGINYAITHHLCYTGGIPSENGGTSLENRQAFLHAHGMTFDRVEGVRDSGTPISLDDVAARFNAGESCGLMLKGTDLSQPDLDKKSRGFLISFDKDKVKKHNLSRNKANHAVTIAGFSYHSSGSVAGVWINDTGNMTGCNRIFISKEKFDLMQKKTDRFAVEFSRRR